MSAAVHPKVVPIRAMLPAPPMPEEVAERADVRRGVVRICEYSAYPRVSSNQRLEVGFTRDESANGMCLDVREPMATGELLRVTVRDIDGTAAQDGLAKVVWCRTIDEGRARVGLCLLREGRRTLLRALPGIRSSVPALPRA